MADPGRIPGPEIIPQGVQLRLKWTLDNGKTIYNVLHGIVAGGFIATSAEAEAIFAAIKASAEWTALRAHLSAGAAFAGVDLRDIRTANQPIVESTGASSAGTGGGPALPPGDALVVTLRTATVGIGSRGRIYLGGWDIAAVGAGGVAEATVPTDASNFVTAVATAMTAQAITLALANPARQAYVGSTGVNHAARVAAMLPVTSIVTRNAVFDHQRRRAGRS